MSHSIKRLQSHLLTQPSIWMIFKAFHEMLTQSLSSSQCRISADSTVFVCTEKEGREKRKKVPSYRTIKGTNNCGKKGEQRGERKGQGRNVVPAHSYYLLKSFIIALDRSV